MDEDWRNTFGIFDVTPGGRAMGCGPKESKTHFVQTVMLHIKSKVMKSRIQRCKTFTLGACLGGHRRSKSRILVPFFFIVTQLLLGFF